MSNPLKPLNDESFKDNKLIYSDQDFAALIDFRKINRLTQLLQKSSIPPEAIPLYNEIVKNYETLNRYASQLEMDNFQMSLELSQITEKAENLSVYAAMVQYRLNTGKGIKFLKKINIQPFLLKNDRFYKKTQIAMNYGTS